MENRVQLGDYITAAEAAKILELTPRRIAQLCAAYRDGDLDGLESVYIVRRWFVKRSAVYSFRGGR